MKKFKRNQTESLEAVHTHTHTNILEKQKNAGITLIALVVTIVVLLILAGVSINLVIGNNGIITKAQDATHKTKVAEVKDKVNLMLGECQIEKYTETITLDDFLNKKKEDGKIDEVTEITDGYEIEIDGYIITIDKDGNIVGEPEKAGPRPQISNIKVVASSDGTGEGLGAKEAELGDTLYITFTHSIEGGTTTVSPALPFAVTANGKYTFTVTGTVNGETKTKDVTVTVNQFNLELKVGDLVNYEYDTAADYSLLGSYSGCGNQTITQTTGLKWKILNIEDDGSVDLITTIPTSNNVSLRGALGYNNGVYIINDICAEQYSNKELKITARNLTLEDIEKNMNDAGILAKKSYNNGTVTNGETKTYTQTNAYYPNLYAQENGSGINTTNVKTNGIGRSEKYYTKPTTETYSQADESGLTVTQDYYTNIYNSYFDNDKIYSLIFKPYKEYWLASRCSCCYSNYASIGLFYVRNSNGTFERDQLFYTNIPQTVSSSHGLRPVVTLKPNTIDISKGKDANGAWQIKTN